MIRDQKVIGITKSGKPVLQAYFLGYGKIKFSDNAILQNNPFKQSSFKDYNEMIEIYKEYGIALLDELREAIEDLLGRDFTKPQFNPNEAVHYTSKNCLTEKEFLFLSSKEVEEFLDYLKDTSYGALIQGAFYMYYYCTRTCLMADKTLN